MILRKHINRRIELQRKLIIQQNFLSSSSVQVWDRIIYGVVLNNFTLQSLNLPNYKMEALGHNLQWKIPAYEIIIPHSSSTDNWTFIPFSKFLGGGEINHIFTITSSVFFSHSLESLRCGQKVYSTVLSRSAGYTDSTFYVQHWQYTLRIWVNFFMYSLQLFNWSGSHSHNSENKWQLTFY